MEMEYGWAQNYDLKQVWPNKNIEKEEAEEK